MQTFDFLFIFILLMTLYYHALLLTRLIITLRFDWLLWAWGFKDTIRGLILLYHIEWAIIDWLCLAWQILKLIMGGVNNNHSQGYYNNHCFKFIFIGQDWIGLIYSKINNGSGS